MTRLAVGTLALLCGLAAATPATALDGTRIQAWEQWLGSLGSEGYGILRGNATIVDNAACAAIVDVFGSCFGNNAAAPYIVPQVPIGDAYSDPLYAPSFTVAGLDGAPSNMLYRLTDREALVTVVNLPPRAAYLGYQSYAFTRRMNFYTTPDDKRVISPDPSRYELFSSFGNDINSAVIGRRLGNVWRAGAVAYVTTANPVLAERLQRSARNAGLDPKRMFVEPIGSNILTGRGRTADDFVTLIRYAVPEHAAAADAWRDKAAANVQVYRVTASLDTKVERFGAPTYTRRRSASEASYSASLAELSGLLKAWLAARQLSPAVIETMISSVHVDATGEPHGLVGADCIVKGTSCLGDNQDTDAYRFGIIGRLKQNRAAFVLGVNHALVDNASYISLAVYDTTTFSGVASASQTNPAAVGFSSGTLTGSAAALLKKLGLYGRASAQLRADLPHLYASALARDCTAFGTTTCIDLSDTTALPLNAIVSVTQRAYLKPGTTTGANPDAMLPPLLVF